MLLHTVNECGPITRLTRGPGQPGTSGHEDAGLGAAGRRTDWTKLTA